jgi:carbon monoxide dehydrogenase subunit G
MWYMRPVQVTTQVPCPREEVFGFLDVMANHEPFTNHILRDWEYSGPDRGVGSKARVKVSAAGRTDTIDIEVVSAQRPVRIVECNTGAGGRRVANGTYTLEQLESGGTKINFEYSWQRAPLSERLMSPLIRSVLRRANEESMRRLKEQLVAAKEGDAPARAA